MATGELTLYLILQNEAINKLTSNIVYDILDLIYLCSISNI